MDPIHLAAEHTGIFRDEDSALRVAEMLISLQKAGREIGPSYDHDFAFSFGEARNSPTHLSRHASSLAVPQEDSMCGDGPSVHDATD